MSSTARVTNSVLGPMACSPGRSQPLSAPHSCRERHRTANINGKRAHLQPTRVFMKLCVLLSSTMISVLSKLSMRVHVACVDVEVYTRLAGLCSCN